MSNIDEVMKDFNKKFKEDLVHHGLSQYDYERIPFTSLRLNYMTFGGLPMGKLIEFFGEEHGGKTTTAMDIVANYQKLYDKKVLWVDCENTFDAVWAGKLNVDVDDLIVFNPTNQGAETIFQFILDMMDTGEVGLVVVDSFGVMESNQSMEKSVEDKTYAGISGALSQFADKAVGRCQKYKCTFIGINQLRDDFNSMWGGKKTTGGRAWKHNVTARIEFSKGKYVDDKGKELNSNPENPAGNIIQARMVKNKTCPPTRRLEQYTINYLTGIDYMSDLVEIAKKFDIIEQSGAWYTVVDVESGEVLLEKVQGQPNLIQELSDNQELLDRVNELVTNKLEQS